MSGGAPDPLRLASATCVLCVRRVDIEVKDWAEMLHELDVRGWTQTEDGAWWCCQRHYQTRPDRKMRVLRETARLRAELGYAPTMREIADATGKASTSSIAYWLDRLEADGFVRMTRHTARTLVITEAGERALAAEVER